MVTAFEGCKRAVNDFPQIFDVIIEEKKILYCIRKR